ncbi:hypothetical protein [Jidongwangia harbinensis]|uniref:hypothetical protein n=1 Tax=Jidongwangia harbinensis TaxID=2878561 RepID=UPI001CD925EA|nr:hypothetical protein [Jidongwangia harbinensis]MCA2215717.1 hypothetical protein [Jidongwangia harbinensis]
MSEERREQRRGRAAGLAVLATVAGIAIGLATEMAGSHLPDIDGRVLWTVLTVLVAIVVAVVVAQHRPRRRRRGRLGRRVRDLTAAQLEVHDPVDVPGVTLPDQTSYVPRAHDERLAAVVRQAAGGASRMVTLVGDSSTGKTRACREAVRKLPRRWRLWHPLDPSRPDALLESLAEVRPYTVVWINDAHHYLATADPEVGERVAAGLRTLLADEGRAPVLILATLWPGFRAQLTATPPDGRPDPHAQARQLLVGTEVTVPSAFTGADLAGVRAAAAHDRRLALAVAEAEAGRVAQYLAGVPELLLRYRTAPAGARAVLDAAIDLRRLGHPVHLPGPLLRAAARVYLSEVDHTELLRVHGAGWFDHVVEGLGRTQHGIPGPLVRVPADGAVVRLADAIDQAGRIDRAEVYPPAPFWEAVAAAVTDATLLTAFGQQAERRGRYGRATQLYKLAADRGDAGALRLLGALRERAWDIAGAEELYRQGVDRGDIRALYDLAALRERAWDTAGAEGLYRQAVDRGDTRAWYYLAKLRERAGDIAGAEGLYRQAVDRGDAGALRRLDAPRLLAALRERAGDIAGAEALYWQAADHGDLLALPRLAALRMRAGDTAGAQAVYRQAADRGDSGALRHRAALRLLAGDIAGAEAVYRRMAELGDTSALHDLAGLRKEAGDAAGAEALYWQAADRGDTSALHRLAEMREHGGDLAGAEGLYRQAIDRGDTGALQRLAKRRKRAGDAAGAEALYRRAVDRGNTGALNSVADLREDAGDTAVADRMRRFGLTESGEVATALDFGS